MSLLVGMRLGPYEVRGPLGAGGMGEVYRARDTRLGRDVAVKVLPAEANQDPDRLRRFEQEARLAGSLNHPNVLTLFDVGSHEGAPYLVTELLEGRTLREVLVGGPLSPQKAVEYGQQIAGGLATAHERGVIHRDLKPANVFVTKSGRVKILDFGLAKLTHAEPRGEGTSKAPTETAEGLAVGTAGYMSPEQVRGHAVDARSDIFALGAVVYEMLSGRRAFEGETPADALSAILHADPPEIATATGPLASGLERIVRRCLEKDPEERFQSARDMAFALEALSASSRPDAAGPGSPPGWGQRWRLAGAALVAVAVAGIMLTTAVGLLRPTPTLKVRQVRRITAGIGAALAGGGGNWATIVSDGVRAYYVAAKGGVQGLWQVPVAGGDSVPIPLPFAGSPIFGYLRSQSALLTLGAVNLPDDFTDDGMALWLVPVPSGTPHRLGRLRAWAAGVSPDERRLAFATKSTLWLADIDGSGARRLLELPSRLDSIRWSPDGTRLRFSAPGEGNRPWIWETAVEKPAPRALWPGRQGEWVEDRRLYVFRRSGGAGGFGLAMSASGSDLFAVPEPRWPWEHPRPVQLTFGPIRFQSPVASGTGGPLLAWGEIAASGLRRLDRRTRRFEPVLEGTSAAYAAWSPDGRQVAWVAYPEGTLWRALADGSERLRLTTAPLEVHQPRFSPDGRTILFLGRTPEKPLRSVYVVSADGTDGGRPRLLTRTLVEGEGCWEACWAADGQSVLFGHVPPDEMTTPARGIYRVGVTGAPPAREPGAETLVLLACSRQGHVLAEGTNGQVVRWAGRRQWEKAPVGLVSPTWTRDGRSICGLAWGTSTVSRIACYSFDRSRFETLATVDLPLLVVANLPAMFLDPDDAPVVVDDRSVRDVYALEWNVP
jgi:Tol biopolymer transport system component